MFYVVPLFVIALLLWIERGAPRPLRFALPAAAIAAIIPAWIPFEDLIGVQAVSDTFGLLTWWEVHDWGVPLDQVWIAAVLAGIAAVTLWLIVPLRAAPVLPALLLVFFLAASEPVEKRIRSASIGELFQGITRPERDWVDRAVGRDADVAALWSGRTDHRTIFENEVFSRSLGPVYTLAGPIPGGLVETALTTDGQTGLLRGPAGRKVRASYAFVDDTVPLAGTVVARDERKGTRVLEVDGLLRLTYRVEGAYDDGWSGPELTYTRYDCSGGTLLVSMESDLKLFSVGQDAVAYVGGREVDRTRIPQDGKGRMRVPLQEENGNCVVRFRISPTAVPGAGDERRLGTHFRTLEYRP
jgi:hypothetical protein